MEPIDTERLILKCLFPNDDLERYLQWMKSTHLFPFIESVRLDYTAEELINYLNEINSSGSKIQLSVFDKKQNRHIGNIKFHDIDYVSRTCFVGFLIGDEAWQNKGVAKEAFIHSSDALYRLFGISLYKLGVAPTHTQAINAYRRMGFVQCVPYQSNVWSGNSILMAQVLRSKSS